LYAVCVFTERYVLDAGSSYNNRCCCNIELVELQGKILLHFFNSYDVVTGSICTLERSVFQGMIIKKMLK